MRFLLLRLAAIRTDSGATAVEYAIMVALIALVIIAAVALFGESLVNTFTRTANEVANI